MKNFTKTFLFALLSLICSETASAYDLEIDGIYYNILSHEDMTVEVTKGDNKYTGDVVIPATVTYKSRTLAVTSIGKEAFRGCTSLISLEIGDSAKSIEGGAFYGCSNLTSLKIPNSITSIGGSAFYRCSSLTNLEIPNSVTSIGHWAFGYCSSLTEIEIPNSVTSIGDKAFSRCSNLTNIVIGNSVTSIEYSTFELCSSLTSIVIGNNVKRIGMMAFNGCSSLTSIVIGENVRSIGSSAFKGCSSLTSIYLQGTTPPSASSFTAEQYIDIILYVPNGSLATYQSADIWKNFWEIKEHDATGIDNISANNIENKFTGNGISVPNAVDKAVYVYSVNGAVIKKLTHYDGGEIVLEKGTYIIRIGEKAIKVQL